MFGAKKRDRELEMLFKRDRWAKMYPGSYPSGGDLGEPIGTLSRIVRRIDTELEAHISMRPTAPTVLVREAAPDEVATHHGKYQAHAECRLFGEVNQAVAYDDDPMKAAKEAHRELMEQMFKPEITIRA
jgi:hypothetical protein